jgi:hypothetical protein
MKPLPPGSRRAFIAALAAGAVLAPPLVGADVNEAPISTISGGSTSLNRPHAVDVDATGRIFSAQLSGGVNIYPWSATGNATRTGVLTPQVTGSASTPLAVRVDAQGAAWVGYNSAYVLRFPAGATTGTAETGALNVNAYAGDNARGIDLDAEGNPVVSSVDVGWVGTFAPPVGAPPPASAATPIRRIAGALSMLGPPNPPSTSSLGGPSGAGQSWGLALDGAGDVVIAVQTRVLRFAGSATGNVAPTGAIDPAGGFTTAVDVAIAPSGNVYVLDRTAPSISVFAPSALDSTSDVDVPIKRIVGAATGLSSPVGIALAPSATPDAGSGTIVVSNDGNNSITRYAAIEPGGAPGTTTPPAAPDPGTGDGGAAGDTPPAIAPRGATPRPRTGLSVNCGATFTNSAQVTLCVTPPVGATTMAISNDGGFAAARTVPVQSRVAWTLDESGPVRIPKTVYARFDGSGVNSDVPYTDDIILDTTAPQVTAAVLVPQGMREAARTRPTTLLRVAATDGQSSIRRMRIAVGGKALRFRDFQRTVRIGGLHGNVRVRVRDRAGNWSAWRPAGIARGAGAGGT